MTTRAIEKVEKLIASLNQLEQLASSPVERVDLADIKSDLDSAREKLEALRAYQETEDTDYDSLWELRKDEINKFQEARNAWIRTEIFSMLLKPE